MTDTNQAETATRTRKAVSKRDYIDANGNLVDKITEASGARYTLKETGQAFDIQIGEPGHFATMLAIFGAHTKLGNVANTVLNDANEPGDATEAGKAIEEFIALGDRGEWMERASGQGGTARIDRDKLAEAIMRFFEEEVTAGRMAAAPEKAKVREGLENPVKVRQTRQVPRILELYNELAGKTQVEKTADDVAKLF